MTKMTLMLIRASLTATYGLYADMWTWCHTTDNSGIVSPPTAYPIILSGGATSGGAVYQTSLKSTSASQLITFTTPYACTAMDILYSPAYAGNWNYSLDGAANVNVVNGSSNNVGRIVLTGLANTTHTLVITGTGPQQCIIPGIVTYKSTTGIGFNNFATAGQQSTFLQDNPWQAMLGSITNSYAAPFTFGYPNKAALYILAIGINDCGFANVRPNQFEYYWDKSIQMIRWGAPNASILIEIPSCPRTYSDTGTATGNPDFWGYYKAVWYRLAQKYTCAVVDMDAKWGDTQKAQGFLNTGNVHPTNAGQADVAATILGVL